MTRHGISDEPSDTLCRRVAFDKCLPCVTCGAGAVDEDPRPVAWIWYFVSSELLMFSLRVTAVAFGVVKVTTAVPVIQKATSWWTEGHVPLLFEVEWTCKIPVYH